MIRKDCKTSDSQTSDSAESSSADFSDAEILEKKDLKEESLKEKAAVTALVAQVTLKGERQQTNHDVTNPLSQGVRKPTRMNSFMSDSSGDE